MCKFCLTPFIDIDLLAENACRVISWCKMRGVPVVKGCNKPLIGDYNGFSGIMVHGDDGMGNLKLPPLKEHERVPLQHIFIDAADFIIKTCMASPGEITLVTLGPFTNIATALQRESMLASTIKAVYSMGGSFCGRGNKSPVAEANVGNDPEAAKIVFASCPVMLSIIYLAIYLAIYISIYLLHKYCQLNLDDPYLYLSSSS